MSGKLIIRTDISVETLRRRARLERDSRVAAIANALDGMSRAEAARAAGMDRRALRDSVFAWSVIDICRLCEERFGVNLFDEWHVRSSEGARP